MKSITLASFVAAQIFASGPATAASPDQMASAHVDGGMFAGARLRVPLGGASPPKPRLMLSLAPMMRSQSADGRVQLRFGEGMAIGPGEGRALRISLAGQPLSAFAPRAAKVDTANANGISTIGWVAIGAGVLLVAGGVIFANALNNASE